MTVIAYRDGVMAGDRLTRSCGVEFHETVKVWRRGSDGALIGCAGMTTLADGVRRWFTAGEQGERPSFGTEEDSSVHALIVRPDGSVEIHDMHGWVPVAPGRGFIAIGSGFELALGAMAMGASALEAVNVAIAFGVGRPCQVDVVILTKERQLIAAE